MLPGDEEDEDADVGVGAAAAALELEDELWHPAVSAAASRGMATAAGRERGRRARVTEVIWSPSFRRNSTRSEGRLLDAGTVTPVASGPYRVRSARLLG
jgi:hypothetical protein